MVSFKEVKKILKALNLPEEERKKFEKLLKPGYDFQSFLMNKLNLSEKGTELLVQAYMDKNKDQLDKKIEEIFESQDESKVTDDTEINRFSKIIRATMSVIKDFAIEQGYPKHKAQKLYESTSEIIEGMVKHQMSNAFFSGMPGIHKN